MSEIPHLHVLVLQAGLDLSNVVAVFTQSTGQWGVCVSKGIKHTVLDLIDYGFSFVH